MEPEKIAIGSMSQITVYIDENPDQPENVFFEPLPIRKMANEEDEGEDGTYMATMGSFNQLKCNFGRFGDTDAVFVDEHTVKCATPSIADDPNDIYAEEVSFSVSMNGLTFPEEGAESTKAFVFEGTGEPMGLLPMVLLILALGVLFAALIYYVHQKLSQNQP